MMNGAKKSDSSIVPAKLANKAERSAAESVEGDDGTKRNAELQSTVRTQSRETVTQAQARIRGAVTRNKKEKLTALLHHVSIDVLRWVAHTGCRRHSYSDTEADTPTANSGEQLRDNCQKRPPLRAQASIFAKLSPAPPFAIACALHCA